MPRPARNGSSQNRPNFTRNCQKVANRPGWFVSSFRRSSWPEPGMQHVALDTNCLKRTASVASALSGTGFLSWRLVGTFIDSTCELSKLAVIREC